MMHLRLINRSGYDTKDLREYVLACMRARARSETGILTVVIVAAPQRSRGCSDIGRPCPSCGRRLVIAIAPPSYYRTEEAFHRRLSRLLDHEILHMKGADHAEMTERDLYSLGKRSGWSRGLRVRYRKRAPRQSGIVRS